MADVLDEVEQRGENFFDDPRRVLKGAVMIGIGLIVTVGPALGLWRAGGERAAGTTQNILRGIIQLGRTTASGGGPSVSGGSYT